MVDRNGFEPNMASFECDGIQHRHLLLMRKLFVSCHQSQMAADSRLTIPAVPSRALLFTGYNERSAEHGADHSSDRTERLFL